jgi:hypothetical protein
MKGLISSLDFCLRTQQHLNVYTGERSRAETQTHNISSRQKENRSRSTCEVGEGKGAEEEEDCLVHIEMILWA